MSAEMCGFLLEVLNDASVPDDTELGVLIRCAVGDIDRVARAVGSYGGSIIFRYGILGGMATAMPKLAVPWVAVVPGVLRMELEQETTTCGGVPAWAQAG